MHRLWAALAAAGIASLAAGGAQAQDTASWTDGFYVRGDLGGAIGNVTTFHDTNPNSTSSTAILGTTRAPAETGVSSLIGAGIGYRLNPIFRGDVTLDYMPGLRVQPIAVNGTPSGYTFGAANFDSTVGLANAYVQLDGLLPGALGRFQPYVDAGIGFAHNRLGTLSINATPGNALNGSTKTNFAWALGAGVAYPITPHLSLDLAYRFLDVGPTATGPNAFAFSVPFRITAAKSDDVTVHTLTAGLRWSFGPVDPLAAEAANGATRDLFWWVPNGVYMRGDLGAAFGNKITVRDTSTNPAVCTFCGTSTIPTKVANSAFFGAGLGYRISPLFRADVTVDDMPSLHAQGSSQGLITGLPTSSDIHALVGLANGYLDLNGFAPGFFGPIQPFIDGGIGLSYNEMSPTTLPLIASAFTGAARTNFAWGAGAGVGYAVTPNLTVEIAYKYLDLGPVETGGAFTTGFASFPVSKLRSNDLTVHTVTAGLRWSFGAPPAPPPAAATAAPPPPVAAAASKQMFIVFFEFDKSSLTADGRKVVDAAAAAFKSGKSGVAIAGYTDLAGTQQYNLALSKRRAETVKAALVKDGVPVSAIDESWHGKENPRVPTADGVREPQNRRVEITM
jgi:OmpA-OmpF porin, OOP family